MPMLHVVSQSKSSAEARSENSSDGELQRANGTARIVVTGEDDCVRVKEIFQGFPIRIMLPRADDGSIEEAVIANIAGGIAGGDRLQVDMTALGGTSIVVTSQTAERVYQALREPARVATTLRASNFAKLAWLPQETIIFNGGRIDRTTTIDVSGAAEVLALEWLVLGRSAHGETMTRGHITDSWRVTRDERLVWMDRFRVTEETFRHLDSDALLANCKAIGTLIYIGPELAEWLEALRGIAGSVACHCAATSVGGIVVVRLAAIDSTELRLALRTFLYLIGRIFGRRPFRMPKMWSC